MAPTHLYHYTSTAGKDGIQDSGFINTSTDTLHDAMLGVGAYLTDLPPSTPKDKLLWNNYGGARSSQEHKIEYYFKIPYSQLRGVTVAKPNGRVIYVCPRRLDLRNVAFTCGKTSSGTVEDTSDWSWLATGLVAGGLIAGAAALVGGILFGAGVLGSKESESESESD